jgi:hypothetical protein
MDQSPIKGFTPVEFHFVHPQALGGTSQAQHNDNSDAASFDANREPSK